MTTGADVLRDAFAASCKSLDRILDGVSDEEFFWEPVAGCWTVHRRSESRGVSADGSGEWVIDWDPAQPKPAPFTTIAWRAVHTAGTNYLYWEHAFGSASPTFDLELPGNAADATHFLSDSQRQVTQTLASLSESDLDKMVRHATGGQRSVHRILAGLINEQVHHGAEISLLRDLYRYRSSLTTANSR
jgi:uncharacterized damage-inducible protein DinB